MQSFEKTRRKLSVTQQFNSSTPMGRLTMNILLSFAEYAECGIMQSPSPRKGRRTYISSMFYSTLFRLK